jgi:hypothetical protein
MYCGCYGSTATGSTTVSLPTPCWTRQELWRGGTVQSPRAASPQAPDWLRQFDSLKRRQLLCAVLRPLSGIPLTAEAQHTIHAPSGCRSNATAGFAWPAGLWGSTTSCAGGAWHSQVPHCAAVQYVVAAGVPKHCTCSSGIPLGARAQC